MAAFPYNLSIILGILCLTLLGWISQWNWNSWLLDLASSFQVQYAIANTFLCLGLLGRILTVKRLRSRRAASPSTPWQRQNQNGLIYPYLGLLLGLGCLSFQLSLLGTWYRPANAVPSSLEAPAISSVKLLSSNVYPYNQEYDRLLNLIEQEQPDLVLLQEVTPGWIEAFEKLHEQLPYHLQNLLARHDGKPPQGNAIYSRFPLTEIPLKEESYAARVGILTQVHHSLAEQQAKQPWFQLSAIHPLVPIRPNFYRQRNQQLAEFFQLSSTSYPVPSLAMGDFNTSLWSPLYNRLMKQRLNDEDNTWHLHQARQGFGIAPSWRPNLFLPRGLRWLGNFFWVPIDHCYISDEITVQRFYTGPDIGSDHIPIISQLSIPQKNPQPSKPGRET